MKRLIISLLLVVAVLATMGAGFRSGSRWGTGIGPGFAPVGRGSGSSSGPAVDPNQAPRTDLFVEHLTGDWTLSDATHFSVWNDASGNNRHASQTVALNQMVGSTDGAYADNNTDLISVMGGYPLNDTHTVVIRWKAKATVGSDLVLWHSFNSTGALHQNQSKSSAYQEVFASRVKVATFPDDVGSSFVTISDYSGGTQTIYSNGVLKSTGNAGALNSDPVINNAGNSTSAGYGGNYATSHYIQAIWIYKRLLTTEEITNSVNWTWKKAS